MYREEPGREAARARLAALREEREDMTNRVDRLRWFMIDRLISSCEFQLLDNWYTDGLADNQRAINSLKRDWGFQ